jgi:SAM-dependent methyltransferase
MSEESTRDRVLKSVQGALLLNVAYVGVANALFSTLSELGAATPGELAAAARRDEGYVVRWCDAAFAFGLLDDAGGGKLKSTELGDAFRPVVEGTLMPFAVQAVLAGHMAERAAGLAKSGERPGERVLAERETLADWFGPMLEKQFGTFYARQILPEIPAYAEVNERHGLAVDLGCGNGWYLRALLQRHPHLSGLGIDGLEANIRQARERAEAEGLGTRLELRLGDLHHLELDRPADLIAMNRALHHVWDRKDEVFEKLRSFLRPGGYAVIWEPNWPAAREELRQPGRAPMAFQNLSEHVQGNHFLRADEIAAAFTAVGMEPRIHLFAEGREAVVTGRRS